MRTIIITALLTLMPTLLMAAPEKLFIEVGPPNATDLPEHVTQAHRIRINRRALQSARIEIDLFGEVVYAERIRIEMHTQGEVIWLGHLAGQSTDSVIITVKGSAYSGMIQKGEEVFRISGGPGGGNRLLEVDLRSLPAEDLEGLPDGLGSPDSSAATGDISASDNVLQDLLVAYTQAACDYAGSCPQLEADIATAVADLNVAYSASGINITMNLVGTMFVDYAEPSSSSAALGELRSTNDGVMDEVHSARDSLGADLVALVYNGPGCGIGYLGSSASTAFSVTDVPCLVGNRTLAHEIGHNQGAHHDRATVGGGSVGSYNYGFRRCNDASIDDLGSPYFRTVLAYPCSGAPRVGRFSNPGVNYSGVPQGVDPTLEPDRGAWNAQTLNESASYVAGFRNSNQQQTPPNSPTALSATMIDFDHIDLSWTDNATNESLYLVEQSLDNEVWNEVASLGSDSASYSALGLNPETTYYFRVKARNGSGDSGYSNQAMATTSSVPTVVEDFAQGENLETGNVSGSFNDTHADDGVWQTITEAGRGGPKHRRQQSFSYTWIFDVTGGPGGVNVTANSWVSGAEAAVFEYSIDFGVTWQAMFVVTDDSSSAIQTFLLPPSTSGSVWIHAHDAQQTNGESVDSLNVDYLVVSSYAQTAPAPSAPTALQVVSVIPGEIAFSFADQSENEVGFEVRRSETSPGLDCSAGSIIATLNANPGTSLVSFTDDTVASQTAYWYTVTAFSGGGASSDCTNHVNVVSAIGGNIALSITGYKEKGRQKASLSWSGVTSANAIIMRDGLAIATTVNDGEYIDNIDQNGGGSYRYQICEQDTPTVCSTEQTLTF